MKPHVLVMNRWPQYRNARQWDHELCRYDEIIPPDCDVSYLCDDEGRTGVPITADVRRVHAVASFDDIGEVIARVARVISLHGPVTHVLAFSEYLLDAAAAVRAHFEIPGHRPGDVDRFRDKTEMKRLLHAAGIRVPAWFACDADGAGDNDARALELGFPLILKPVRGASSKGVLKVESIDAWRRIVQTRELRGFEIEEYIDGDILHVDGVVDAFGQSVFMSVSRYISSCLEFEAGVPLGSVIQTESPVTAACRAFAAACVQALGLHGSAFHLELFERDGELIFLEVGARVPGADVPYVVHRVFGVNLFRLWVDVVLGNSSSPPRNVATSGGWLTIPRPAPLPRKVVIARSLVGRVPGLYRELIPAAGEMLTDTGGGYTHLQGGRFLVEGRNEAQVLASMDAIRTQYVLETVPA
ncbi:carboxylate--amine ligase [Burkholderia singularis]|uniref:Carboxylate--amine ligase n=1 Tax=Burkholderia singularis TaxID=1503053 RepID=A0A103E1J0_9BURK|nr:ATP-grasp domain-containing protein [Burkholderia singularis]KVE26653.1 carboxylate--amine ligase [Burkholderia singularis]